MSYRPHNSGHDYYDKGIYLITLVVGNRDRLLGELNMDVRNPSVSLAPWSPETIGDVNGIPKETDYSIFHNLNRIAEEICTFNGTAVVKRE